jgi:hypothetical protein
MEANFKVVIKRTASKDAKDTNDHPPVQDKISIIDCAQEMEKQEEEKIFGKKEESKSPNIFIFAKNTVTLDDYIVKTYFDDKYIPQLEKWIKKRKFAISLLKDAEDRPVELLLSVEFFSFKLRKIKRPEAKILQEELTLLKKNRTKKIKKKSTCSTSILSPSGLKSSAKKLPS